MATSIRSHAFFIGNLHNNITPGTLVRSNWTKVIENNDTYNFLCSYFHKSHVDAMIEAHGQQRPKFLNQVHHYKLDINASIPFSSFNAETGHLTVFNDYKLNIIGLHVYFMPLDITLYAVEIDDSGSDLNDLTLAHLYIREFPTRWDQFNDEFRQALAPIKTLCAHNNASPLFTGGNKLKTFQVLMVDEAAWTNEHLYEIGTCSPVDIVGTSHDLAPSHEYYTSIIKDNMIAPFKTWKSLSLMDSFTALIKWDENTKEKNWESYKATWINSYYRLIFLRVLMQKAYLSSQNIQYRLKRSGARSIRGLARMEQYYFYDNISYNFLPDMLNKQMENGMAINEEKAELSAQIKECDSKNTNTLMVILSVFAIFSISNNIYTVVKDITHRELPIFLSVISGIALICIILLIIRLVRRQ